MSKKKIRGLSIGSTSNPTDRTSNLYHRAASGANSSKPYREEYQEDIYWIFPVPCRACLHYSIFVGSSTDFFLVTPCRPKYVQQILQR